MGSPRHRRLVIMPAYNEADCVESVVREVAKEFPDADILVVDDGSNDGTAYRVPHELAEVISLPFNLGIGGAMQTGYRYAAEHGYDLAIQVDADGQHPPTEVRKLVDRLERDELDLVIGSRFLGPRRAPYPTSHLRRTAIRVISSMLRVLSGARVTDPTSGFRVANRGVIEAFAYWYPADFPEPEVILLLERDGHRIAEQAVDMIPRATGESSIPFSRGLFYVSKIGVSLVLDTMRRPWPRITQRVG